MAPNQTHPPQNAIVLAGGTEFSQSPYNQVFPKPMLPLGNMPLTEVVLRYLRKWGVSQFHLIVTPMSGTMLQAYLQGHPLQPHVHFYWDSEGRGTAGGLNLVREILGAPTWIINSDAITTLNLHQMWSFHCQKQSLLTLASYPKAFYLDFGFIERDGQRILGYREKPTLTQSVSMGIYLVEPQAAAQIPDSRGEISQWIQSLITQDFPIYAFQQECQWLEVHTPDGYTEAQKEFQKLQKWFLEETIP